MKNKIICTCLVFLLLQGISYLAAPLICEEISSETPVQVFYKGEKVKNLAKEDFELYVNGEPREIVGVAVKSKKFIAEADQGTEKSTPRTLILVYKLTDFGAPAVQSVDYIIDNLLQENDRLVLIADEQVLQYPLPTDREKMKNEIKDIVKKKSVEKKEKLLPVKKIFEAKALAASRSFIEIAIRSYLVLQNEYKVKYLSADFDWFNSILDLPGDIPGEKWVFHFYQLDIFPRMGLTPSLWYVAQENVNFTHTDLNRTFNEVMKEVVNQVRLELDANKNLLTEETSKSLHKANAVLYSFMFKPGKKAPSNDVTYPSVREGLKSGLKHLAEVTGGAFFHSKDTIDALNSIKEKEDYYYILSYMAEKSGKETVKIEIKTKNKKYKVSINPAQNT